MSLIYINVLFVLLAHLKISITNLQIIKTRFHYKKIGYLTEFFLPWAWTPMKKITYAKDLYLRKRILNFFEIWSIWQGITLGKFERWKKNLKVERTDTFWCFTWDYLLLTSPFWKFCSSGDICLTCCLGQSSFLYDV
jgi:hypothetical protein